MHFHRAGGANILPINGPQVVNAVANQTLATPAFRTTQRDIRTEFADPSRFNPLLANITYMPEDYHSSRAQSYFISVQREIARNMILDVAYVGNRADDLLLFANFNQAAPNNPQGTLSLQERRPIQEFADITYAFNGGRSRYNALQVKYEYRMRHGLMMLNSFTWSKAKDNGAGSLEGPFGNIPAPQDFYNLDADYGTSAYDQPLNNTTSVVWSLPVGRGRRWLSNAGALTEGTARRLDDQRHQHDDLRRGGDVALLAGGEFPGVRHPAGFPRREQLSSEPERRSLWGPRLGDELSEPRHRDRADRSQPAVRQRAAQQRPRAVVLADGPRRREGLPAAHRAADASTGSVSKRSTCSTR